MSLSIQRQKPQFNTLIFIKVINIFLPIRGVAQLGSARRSGRRGRRFKSGYPDKFKRLINNILQGFSENEKPFFCENRPKIHPFFVHLY